MAKNDDFEYLSKFRDEVDLKPEEIKASEVPRTFGTWMVKRQMGGGGFGLVFEAARQLVSDGVPQRGALKVTKVKKIGALERVLYNSEVSSLLKLQDTVHVATLLDCGIKDNMPWIVSRLIKGQDLRKHLMLHGPLNKNEWMKLADNIFRALKKAHSLQVVHRDITPANVLVADGDDIFVLIDFGLAVFEDIFFEGAVGGARSLSTVSPGAGTLLYQAPEQVDLDPRSNSDIFAAGLVLYEAATGQHPWLERMGISHFEKTRTHKQELLRLIKEGEPTYSGMDEDQARFLKRLLKKEPEDRLPADLALDFLTAWNNTGVLDLGYYGSSYEFDSDLVSVDRAQTPSADRVSSLEIYDAEIVLDDDLDLGFKQSAREMMAPRREPRRIKDWSQIQTLVYNYFDELPSSDFSAVIAIKDMGSLGITGMPHGDQIAVEFKIDGDFTSWRRLESKFGRDAQVLDPSGRADLLLPREGGIQYLAEKIMEVLKSSFGDVPPEIRIY
jgi:serine/threonine protein kinase